LELRIERDRVDRDGTRVSGAKKWAFRYRRQSDGVKRTATLGAYPEYSLEQARQWAGELRAAVARGEDPAGARRARKAAETFGQVAVEWVKRHGRPNKARLTLKRDIQMLRRHILPEMGATKAREVTKRDVIRLLDNVAARPDGRLRTRKGVGTSRRMTHQPNRVFELVRSIFRWAHGRDLVKADPTAGISPPIKKEKVRERELSPAEIRTLWLALDRAPVGRGRGAKGRLGSRQKGDFPMRRATAVAIRLALVTAQRIGEVSGMSSTELDLNDTAPIWTIPGARSKNGEPNRVPLSPLAVRLIAEARELAGQGAWLFPSPKGGGAIEPTAPAKALDRARPAIGLPEFRVHDLRRTAATRMAESGVHPHTISLVLNHVSVRRGTITGKVYNQYSYDREKREALVAWGARLERIVAGTDGANVVPMAANT
jgi:integrase